MTVLPQNRSAFCFLFLIVCTYIVVSCHRWRVPATCWPRVCDSLSSALEIAVLLVFLQLILRVGLWRIPSRWFISSFAFLCFVTIIVVFPYFKKYREKLLSTSLVCRNNWRFTCSRFKSRNVIEPSSCKSTLLHETLPQPSKIL